MTLGAVDLSEVNQMYQTIANLGTTHELHSITAITSHDDELLWYRGIWPSNESTKARLSCELCFA